MFPTVSMLCQHEFLNNNHSNYIISKKYKGNIVILFITNVHKQVICHNRHTVTETANIDLSHWVLL